MNKEFGGLVAAYSRCKGEQQNIINKMRQNLLQRNNEDSMVKDERTNKIYNINTAEFNDLEEINGVLDNDASCDKLTRIGEKYRKEHGL